MKQIPLLYTDVQGSGPTVVLLHGFLASSRYWEKVAELASKNYKVIAVDLLGFGSSPKPKDSSYDYADHIVSINRTLERLEIDEPFILMGHSMGSLIALRYATLYDERVSKLILTNMPAMIGRKEVRETIFKQNLVYRLGLSNYTNRLMWPMFHTLYKLRWLPRTSLTRIQDNIAFMFQSESHSRMRSFRRVIEDARIDLDLHAVKAKTVILAGVEDKKIYLENLLHNIPTRPNIRVETVATGHHIPRIMPEFIAQKIGE
jgi:pimeloyl-ACP methyl ester carboxylesterase